MEQTTTITPTVISFLSIEAFKAQTACTAFSVIKNPKTGKLFVQSNTGINYKCQADLDVNLPMTFLIPDNNMENACLVNTHGDNLIATL